MDWTSVSDKIVQIDQNKWDRKVYVLSAGFLFCGFFHQANVPLVTAFLPTTGRTP